jgi:uridine phosphorylase
MSELMISSTYPILEFDNTRKAILEPSEHIPPGDVPSHAVICFFAEVIQKVVHDFDSKVIFISRSEMGEHPIYEIKFQEKRLAFFHTGIGAPLAVGLMEEVIALGVKNFIACGGCGVLDKTLSVGKLMLPTSAIRDEGTSYHYLPPSREIEMDLEVEDVLSHVLQSHNLPFIKTKTWTTDAIYRETAQKVKQYKGEGCLAVEMEAAALMALARFRQVKFGQILYAGDSVMSEGWDGRAWHSRKEIRENLFWLSAEACLKL